MHTTPPGRLQQRGADDLLQPPDLLAQGRLGDEQALSAAWVKVPASATATKYRKCRSSRPCGAPSPAGRVDLGSSEAILGYRLRQRHVGAVAWIAEAGTDSDSLGRLEHAAAKVAVQAQCGGRPIFIPQDESSAWVWFPLGSGRSFPAQVATAAIAGGSAGIRFAIGAPAPGVAGFRRTHRQALSAQAVALAAGPSSQLVTSFDEVAPLALMSGSAYRPVGGAGRR
jgi:hypothetical protein